MNLAGECLVVQAVAVTLDLRTKLINVSIFSGSLLGLLGLTWLFRPYLRRKAAAKGLVTEAAVSMKTLATMSIASRQKVQLIQVGNQQILLGVGPDSVTFLTNIAGAPQPLVPVPTAAQQQSFTRMLAERSAELEMKQAPVLKKIPGNDPESLSQPKTAPAKAAEKPKQARVRTELPAESAQDLANEEAATPKAKTTGNRIAISVGEDGVKNHKLPKKDDGEGQKAIDDVTRMIREKLKTLRTI